MPIELAICSGLLRELDCSSSDPQDPIPSLSFPDTTLFYSPPKAYSNRT